MEKIEFNIKYRPQIESGEYKVETSFGESVEIVKWDCKGGYPLLACIDDGDTDDSAFYTEDGRAMSHPEISYLVLVTPDPMTEFEKAVGDLCWRVGLGEVIKDPAQIKIAAKKLLELARKELIEEQITSDPRKTDLYKLGKAEAMKDFNDLMENLYKSMHDSFKEG